jgi:hypothetical protein
MHGGTLVLDGLSPFTFDSASIPTLDGNLDLLSDASLALVKGVSFDLFDGLEYLDGATFSHVALPTLDAGLAWDISMLYTDGSVTVIPEPSSAYLLLIAGVSLWVLRQHRRDAVWSRHSADVQAPIAVEAMAR